MRMLQARNENGQLIHLTKLSELEKECLRRQVFYCPACQTRVQLKKGKIKTWYFAHVCRMKKKPADKKIRGAAESALHIEGKEALYQWIQKETPLVQKEFIRKEVMQRPDIYCVYKARSFAIEYQCAAIDAEVLRSRTQRHIESCDVPIWIVGRSIDTRQNQNRTIFESPMYFQDLFSLFPVTYIFEQPFTHLKICMPIAAFSPRKILYDMLSVPKNIPFFQAVQTIPLHFSIDKMKNDWLREKKKYRLSNQLHPNRLMKYLFQFFPQNHLAFPLLPATVGVPVLYSYHLYSHCVEWQLWFQLCILFPMEMGEKISLTTIRAKWCEMIQRGYIVVRPLPLVYKTNHFDALKAYLIFLEELGMLTIKGGYIQKGRSEQRQNHMEDIFQEDKNILNDAFIHLKSQLKLMVEKNEKG